VLPLESVPNVSEGRDAEALDRLARAFGDAARLLDVHADVDHHRSVFTLVGDEDELFRSLLAGIRAARDVVDLRRHDGVHPRVGAADVVPVVPLDPEDMSRARVAARRLGERVGDELGLPVFLYGEIAGGIRPSFFRRGGPAELQRRVDAGELAPSYGPRRLDPSAGAVLVGARKPLVAYNLELRTDDLEVGRGVAAAVRETGGGLPGVQALGLRLAHTGTVQVSTNLIDVDRSSLHDLAAAIVREADIRGVEAGGAELVGLVPAVCVLRAGGIEPSGDSGPRERARMIDASVLQRAGAALRLPALDASRILEVRALAAVDET
jgi:glutamate formiminotransferase